MNLTTIMETLELLDKIEHLNPPLEPGVIGTLRGEAFCVSTAIRSQLKVAGIDIKVKVAQ